jgi:cytochrome b6-f complex iron-sulfur subunit
VTKKSSKPGKGLKETTDSMKERRSFLNVLLGSSLLMFVTGTIYPVLRFLWPSQAAVGSTGESVVTVPLNDLTMGSARIIRYKNTPTLLIRQEPSEVVALSAVCPHLGCLVKWDEIQRMIVCPCHAALFDVQGNVLAGPAPAPLPTIPARIVGDKILVGEA